MSRALWDEITPDRVRPDQLSLLLSQHGWRHVGGRDGLYARWAAPDVADEETAELDSVVVPLNRETADYSDLVSQAIAQLRMLAAHHQTAAERVLSALSSTETTALAKRLIRER